VVATTNLFFFYQVAGKTDVVIFVGPVSKLSFLPSFSRHWAAKFCSWLSAMVNGES
jgi:hypothetical protein